MDNLSTNAENQTKPTSDVELGASSNQEIMELLRANLEMTKEIQVLARHINNYVAWQRIFGWLKVLLILIPILIGVLYLPPLFKDALSQYSSLLNGGVSN